MGCFGFFFFWTGPFYTTCLSILSKIQQWSRVTFWISPLTCICMFIHPQTVNGKLTRCGFGEKKRVVGTGTSWSLIHMFSSVASFCCWCGNVATDAPLNKDPHKFQLWTSDSSFPAQKTCFHMSHYVPYSTFVTRCVPVWISSTYFLWIL